MPKMIGAKEETNIGAHALLLTKDNKVVLQKREKNPRIVNQGLVAMFGGTLKKGEKVERGLERELKEELSINLKEYNWQKLAVFYKTKAMDGVDWTVHVFVVRGIETKALRLNEGAGLIVGKAVSCWRRRDLTRITRLALRTMIASDKNKTCPASNILLELERERRA